jgi:hypothetical protein
VDACVANPQTPLRRSCRASPLGVDCCLKGRVDREHGSRVGLFKVPYVDQTE